MQVWCCEKPCFLLNKCFSERKSMDFGIVTIGGVCFFGYVMFKMGHSYGYKSAREDLRNNGRLNDNDG